MAYQTVFKRYELKYLINAEQKEKILEKIAPYMKLDKYGRSTIRNIYYDTDTMRLIRRSIEKPVYKEKLRIRSYERATKESDVFVELKKKYKSVVYKRRIALPLGIAESWLGEKSPCGKDTQITREIDYFLSFYESLHPTVFLSYEREAYYSLDKSDFRVTFDENIFARDENLSLEAEPYGTPLLRDGQILMEIKCSGGIPLFMTEILSAEHIYKTSFSKYGTAYATIIFPKLKAATDSAEYAFKF